MAQETPPLEPFHMFFVAHHPGIWIFPIVPERPNGADIIGLGEFTRRLIFIGAHGGIFEFASDALVLKYYAPPVIDMLVLPHAWISLRDSDVDGLADAVYYVVQGA